MNGQTTGSIMAPLSPIKSKLSVTVTEADNGFIMSWYSPFDGSRTYLALTLEEVGIKFSELFSK